MYGGMTFEVLASTESCLADDTLKGPIGRFPPLDCRDGHDASLVCTTAVSVYDAMVTVERWLKGEVKEATNTTAPDSDIPRRIAPLGSNQLTCQTFVFRPRSLSLFGEDGAAIFDALCCGSNSNCKTGIL